MKNKFQIGDKVRNKITERIYTVEKIGTMFASYIYWMDECVAYMDECVLKKYSPTRTGKYRNSRGQFVSNGHLPSHDMTIIGKWWVCDDCFYRERIDTSDSKQRNYQKILSTLERIEKKIDELGRKV